MSGNIIPPITDPLGRYWEQPSTENILIDDHHAIMSADDWKLLKRYDASLPTGAYAGKMWASVDRWNDTKYLWWYVDSKPGYVRSVMREVIIV